MQIQYAWHASISPEQALPGECWPPRRIFDFLTSPSPFLNARKIWVILFIDAYDMQLVPCALSILNFERSEAPRSSGLGKPSAPVHATVRRVDHVRLEKSIISRYWKDVV
ncbi:hypothetical protein PM082_021668 [Marasmius tenuissimus]|nr:hypothetical protein PM082_021668 [Marasmius tenuissimus]